MKTIRFVVVAILFVVMTGCASTGGHDNTTTGAVGGGLLGGGIAKAAGGSAIKGATAGALLGAGIGVFADHKDRQDTERAEKIDRMIEQKTGTIAGIGNTQVAGAISQVEANLAFAKGEKDKCDAAHATYKKAGIKRPYECEKVFDNALRDADNASPAYYGYGKCSDSYLLAHGVRPESRHADMWCKRFRDDEQGYGRAYSYRR